MQLHTLIVNEKKQLELTELKDCAVPLISLNPPPPPPHLAHASWEKAAAATAGGRHAANLFTFVG